MGLSAERDTKKIEGVFRHLAVAADAVIFAGALVVVKADGFAYPATAATGLIAVGRAAESVDNTGGSDGDKSVRVEAGTFFYKNSANGDAITRADIGSKCFLVDDETVAKTNGSNARSQAGFVFDVDAVLGVAVTIGETNGAALADAVASVEAAGTTQGDATALPDDKTEVFVVTNNTAANGVKLPANAKGKKIVVYGTLNAATLVYPPTGGKINDGSANAVFTLTARIPGVFYAISATDWIVVSDKDVS